MTPGRPCPSIARRAATSRAGSSGRRRAWIIATGSTAATPSPIPRRGGSPKGPTARAASSNPSTFEWSDDGWRGVKIQGQVIYELHLGTFTAEGTWEAAARELPELKELGVTVVEVMPVAEFPGEYGWGYDGVNLYAPITATARPTTCGGSSTGPTPWAWG